jgi:hypothetical protein
MSWLCGDMGFDRRITTADYTGIDSALGFGQGNPLAVAGPVAPAALPTFPKSSQRDDLLGVLLGGA